MITLHYIDFNGDEESEHHSRLTLKNGTSFSVVETVEEIKSMLKSET